jgi:CRISPR-associated protein Csd1
MSWMQRLTETYDACFGQLQFEPGPLTPIDHVEQQAHIEIALDEQGNFLRASIIPKEITLIPVTEKSAGRTSGPVAHPLCDKLRYVAADYGSEDHSLYLEQLRVWARHSRNSKVHAVLSYVERGTVVRDLLRQGLLVARDDGSLETRWDAGLSPLAKLLTSDSKTKERDQGNALIRWRVEVPGERESAVWKDPNLQREWASFNATLPSTRGICLVSGAEEPLATNHPKRLRHGGDGAKLISSNDSAGFTFRGRFRHAGEAYGLGTSTTQKAHNALRWLIARQGAKLGDQVIVAWAVQGASAPPLLVDSTQFITDPDDESSTNATPQEENIYRGDAGQAFALRLRKAVRGYQAMLGDSANIVVMVLDSATPGRMAIRYYRELEGSEFLARLEQWHSRLAWPQDFGKDRRFLGAPAPRDIAEAAYGRRLKGDSGDKLLKATIERLLPCIVDNRPLPRDLVVGAVRRATNRAGLERWEFERTLGIACSLVRGTNPKEYDKMSLDEQRSTRDYLYGRLLAVADSIEELSLKTAKENRETNAARLMQRFADHPYTTWRTLELQLRPYIARLRNSRYAGALVIRQRLLDRLPDAFPSMADGASSFTDNRPLAGEFLLGYHSQREALRPYNPPPQSPLPPKETTE